MLQQESYSKIIDDSKQQLCNVKVWSANSHRLSTSERQPLRCHMSSCHMSSMTATDTAKSYRACCRVFVHMGTIFEARSIPKRLRADMSHSLYIGGLMSQRGTIWYKNTYSRFSESGCAGGTSGRKIAFGPNPSAEVLPENH